MKSGNLGKVTFESPIGGYGYWILNKTGGPSIKGYIAEPSSTTDNAVQYTTGGDIDPMAIVYDDGVPDGEMMRVITSGIAEVYYPGNVVRATFSRVPTVGEALADGHAINEPLPVPPFATDKHFQEIGHPTESITGPGLAKTNLHWN